MCESEELMCVCVDFKVDVQLAIDNNIIGKAAGETYWYCGGCGFQECTGAE